MLVHLWVGSDPSNPYVTCFNVSLATFIALTIRDEANGIIVCDDRPRSEERQIKIFFKCPDPIAGSSPVPTGGANM